MHAEYYENEDIKKFNDLNGKTIASLFFEPSTRTKTTFELASKKLSADFINIDVANSSTNKGESVLDMIKTLEAMDCDMFIVRHSISGTPHYIAQEVGKNIAVVNAFSSLYQVGEGSDWLKQFLPGEEELKSGSEKDQERAQLTRERALNRWRESRYFTIREAAEAHASYLFSLRRDWSLLEDIELLEAIESTTLRLGEAYRTHYFNTVGGGELTTIVSEVLDTNFPDHPEEWITVLTSGLSNVESNRPTKACLLYTSDAAYE